MSKEIELLYRWYKGARDTDDFSELYDKTEELLAQPEQDPVTKEPTETNMYDVYRKEQVAWGLYDLDSDTFISIYGYEERPDKILKNRFKWVKVYLAPPKREPLSDDEIYMGFQSNINTDLSLRSFLVGVRFAEKAYGIGDKRWA